ncbi:MAG: DEAD/DEAH box helicase, partial [Oceanococcus sp.]
MASGSEQFDWSGFHPATQQWFERQLGSPTPAQLGAWPHIQQGLDTLVAAPTGSGKTLAAFLAVIDALVTEAGEGALPLETRVLYVSPLKALSNDIRKNLQAPLNGIADALLESGQAPTDITAMVRTGDTLQRERSQMRRKPPHILVTTPESLFILLGSESGRAMLSTVRSVIVDEIHALVGNKRGAHLSLSLARLQALVGQPLQRIGLSATQKPVARVAEFLTGGEPCKIVDDGHVRPRDLALEVPGSPLTAVMAGEVWAEVYERLAALALEHSTTLVFVNTRRMAERLTRHLAERLGEVAVAAHHGSLSKEHRLDAEQRLKAGELKVLVATASLELGIDIGDVDLVCQIGSPRGINAFLQRVGRSGHAVGATPKGRLFPSTLDEAVECAALLVAVEQGQLDALGAVNPALDVLSQQLVAEVANRDWPQDELLQLVRQAWPYRSLTDKQYLDVVRMLAEGYTSRRGRRGAYIHWDQVNGILRGRRGARLVALTNAGVIPDQFDYDVVLMPDGFRVGTLNEDFAFETLAGDIFQLGNQSYRVLKTESSRVLVEDARGQPPTMPFWVGEAPGRSDELSLAVSQFRLGLSKQLEQGRQPALDFLVSQYPLSAEVAVQLVDYLGAGEAALGAMPSQETVVLERFFDETGDMHLVVHSTYGSRINKAWGLALRKRFCRKFNFELQAAALEDSIVLSLGVTHSFPLVEIVDYLKADSVRGVLEQALLDAPMFPTHWRWNASTALAIRRHLGNRKTPPAWQRNDAEDLMAVVFPDQIACAENLSGKREIPDHPLVTQTMEDCLFGLMDLPGLEQVLSRLHKGEIKVVCADLTAPSPLAQEILNARPYAFLDDGDAEARRTMAIAQGGHMPLEEASSLAKLDAAAIAKVREQAWPSPSNAEELHEALLIHGAFNDQEMQPWTEWTDELMQQMRLCRIALPSGKGLWMVAERLALYLGLQPEAVFLPQIQALAQDEPDPLRELLRGRLEASGPIRCKDLSDVLGMPIADIQIAMLALENEGFAVRGEFDHALQADEQWCERRLLARIHRYTR